MSVKTEDALDDEVVEPVGDSGPPPSVDVDGDSPPSEVSDAKPDVPFVFVVVAPPAANIDGLRSGETARELNGDEDDDGEVLRNPPLRFVMLLIVLAMVCRAACLARSVETKLLTSSFRLPFTSGAAKRSSDFATSGFLSILSKLFSPVTDELPPLTLDGRVADFDVMNEGEDSPDTEDGAIGVTDDEIVNGFNREPFNRGTVDVTGCCCCDNCRLYGSGEMRPPE